MGRKFIVERGGKVNLDRQSDKDRKTRYVRYTIDEVVEIFIRAKEAEGIRKNTIKVLHNAS